MQRLIENGNITGKNKSLLQNNFAIESLLTSLFKGGSCFIIVPAEFWHEYKNIVKSNKKRILKGNNFVFYKINTHVNL
jgi:hypothetical protein